MNKIIRKYTSKVGYKIIRKLVRKIGFDIIPLELNKVGEYPYYDMSKFISSQTPMLFDVGANYGQTIDDFREVFKNGIINSFEPSPITFDGLKKNTYNMKNVFIWNCGIGSSTKPMILNENTHRNMSSFLEMGDEGWGIVNDKTTVSVTTIDEFCKEHKIEKIDVLKIDTQGFELEVLKGARTSMLENRIGLLYFEVTFIDMYKGLPSFGELYDFAIDHGFELISIYPIKYKKNMAGWTDILFKHKKYNS
jgi:FkbM family methyltransferase